MCGRRARKSGTMVAVSTLPGDPKRARTEPTEVDRARVVGLLRSQAGEGRLSSRGLDDAMEEVFRAKSLAELDAVLSSTGPSARVQADFILAHGLEAPTSRKKKRSFLERQLWYSGILLVLWIIVWLATGMGFEWFILILLTGATGFAFRVARGDRKKGLFGASRRSLGR
jgi:hypothetical protein